MLRVPLDWMSSLELSDDPEFAEVLGVLLGDGCVSQFLSNGKTILEVAFTGNESEFLYYRDFVKRIIELHFPVHGRLISRGDNTTRLHFRSVKLARYLLSLGIPLGKKRDASIPQGVIRSGLFIHFVRGFYHAEGSIYRRYSKQYAGHGRKYDHLLSLQFRCKLKTLMFGVYTGLIAMGLKPTKMSEKEWGLHISLYESAADRTVSRTG